MRLMKRSLGYFLPYTKRIVLGVAGMLAAREIMTFSGQKQRLHEMQHGCATQA